MNHYVNDSFASISFNYHTYYKKVDSQCTKVTYLYITVDSLLWWWGHYFRRYLWVMVFHEQFSFLKHLISKFVKPRNLVLYPQKVSRKKIKESTVLMFAHPCKEYWMVKINFSLHLTAMCLQYKPTIVACVCVHLACKWSKWEVSDMLFILVINVMIKEKLLPYHKFKTAPSTGLIGIHCQMLVRFHPHSDTHHIILNVSWTL